MDGRITVLGIGRAISMIQFDDDNDNEMTDGGDGDDDVIVLLKTLIV